MRNIAAPLGVGIAMSRPNVDQVLLGAKRAPVWAKLLAGLVGIGVGRTLLACPLPKRESCIYAGALVQFCFFSFAVTYGIPYVLYKQYRQVNKTLEVRSSEKGIGLLFLGRRKGKKSRRTSKVGRSKCQARTDGVSLCGTGDFVNELTFVHFGHLVIASELS
ncbi:hypothetical protein HPB51_017594 [Rhipicephalus microplus]|uniref:Uncharacterized protein n=1 Tax=Rhipicephalus microplus TaxID=6941 RepID=A0A9J6E1U2_RHIMP|nr:hypothetical protein HPB51_017594 [Rhipicephalus microplus]